MAQIKLQNIAHSYNPNSVDSKYALKPFDMTWALPICARGDGRSDDG